MLAVQWKEGRALAFRHASYSEEKRKVTAVNDEITVPEGHGLMHELNKTGDTRVMWDRANSDEVAAARAQFEALTKKGFIAYRAEGKEGTRGEVIRKFDPEAERIILVRQLVGG
jgi:hypothetical protein